VQTLQVRCNEKLPIFFFCFYNNRFDLIILLRTYDISSENLRLHAWRAISLSRVYKDQVIGNVISCLSVCVCVCVFFSIDPSSIIK